jgi:hypothetical protein
MKYFFKLIIVMLILLLISACQPKQVDEYIRGTDSCSPPCWQGILPGVTTKLEAIETVMQLESDGGGNWNELPEDIRWRDYNRERPIYLHIKNDLVQYIRLEVDSITLQYVIDNYGDPDSFSLDQCPDCLGYSVSLNYPNLGLIFLAESRRMSETKRLFMDGYEITPEMNVNLVYFFSPSDISAMFYLFCETEECVNQELQRLHTWPGFGVFNNE